MDVAHRSVRQANGSGVLLSPGIKHVQVLHSFSRWCVAFLLHVHQHQTVAARPRSASVSVDILEVGFERAIHKLFTHEGGYDCLLAFHIGGRVVSALRASQLWRERNSRRGTNGCVCYVSSRANMHSAALLRCQVDTVNWHAELLALATHRHKLIDRA